MARRATVSVHLLPSLIPPDALTGGVAVVIDVLRASTAMIQALASGCETIRPCLEIEDARRLAGALPEGSVLLAGERQGVPIAGFAFGNSPSSFTPVVCEGKTLVITTTNGTRAILASQKADRVLIASWLNFTATARVLRAETRPLHLVCSGTDGCVSFEDTSLAGAFVLDLADRPERPLEPGNDAALIALELARGQRRLAGDDPHWLARSLRLGRGGHRVAELGFEADFEVVAQVDRFDLIAELKHGPLRIERVITPL